MEYNFKFFTIFIILSLIINIHSELSLVIAKGIDSYCDKNLFRIIIDIDIVRPQQDYITFYLTAYSVENLLFKCIINSIDKQILCTTNLQQHKLLLNKDDAIILPYPFPEVDGIIWDYNSFLYTIFRRRIVLNGECGESVLKTNISRLNTTNWDLITKINSIYDGQCLLSDTKDNFYSFKMNLNIIGGNLKEQLDQSINDKTDFEINFIQNITMPFIIGPLQNLIKNAVTFQSHEYYKMAFCYPLYSINTTTYLKEEGIDFYCNIPISDQYIFNGPLKIKTFSDNVFAEISEGNEDDIVEFISIYFSTEKNPILKDSDKELIEGEEEDDDDFNKDDDDEVLFEEEKEKEKEKNIVFEDDDFEDEKEKGKENEKEKEKEKENENENENEDKEKEDDKSIDQLNKNKNIENLNIIDNSSSSGKQSSSVQSPSKSSSSFSLSSSAKPSPSSAEASLSAAKPSNSPGKSSSNTPSTSSSASNLRGLQTTTGTKKKKEYLLLDNRKTNFICPDKPIFEIVNIENGITYEPILDKQDKYNIILKGYLKNGYKVLDKKITPLEYTTNEIKFNLSITNNLIEEISEKKKVIPCKLNSGTLFLEKDITTIKCVGDKLQQKNMDNTDITVNWASKENKYLNDIVIKWPKDLRIHSKKLYSYNINALSINKLDHDCFEDKYYFYVNILDLKSEPQISFEFRMQYPISTKSICKLYTSKMLKCYLDLRLKRIKEGQKIKLPFPGNYNISTFEGNYINFTILNFTGDNETNFADEGILAEDNCGNNMFVGAIQDIGYGYGSAIAIIISIIVIFIVAFLGIGYCVIYEITHRNKKGKYFAHTEEKKEENKSNVSASVNPINPTLPNIVPK